MRRLQVYAGDDGVTLVTHEGKLLEFDHVVIGAHADEALKLLIDPSEKKKICSPMALPDK